MITMRQKEADAVELIAYFMSAFQYYVIAYILALARERLPKVVVAMQSSSCL
jgi:hypothetical protein